MQPKQRVASRHLAAARLSLRVELHSMSGPLVPEPDQTMLARQLAEELPALRFSRDDAPLRAFLGDPAALRALGSLRRADMGRGGEALWLGATRSSTGI